MATKSLCFGSQINFLRNLDSQEFFQIASFVQFHFSELMTENQLIIDQFITIMVNAAEDATAMPFFSDDQVAEIVTMDGVNIIDSLSESSSGGFNMVDTFL